MQARRRAQPSGTNSPSSSHPRLKHRARCAIFRPCPPCGRQGRPGQGFLAGSNTSEPRGSAPRERDHRGGDHPVPSRTRQLSPPSPRVLQREAAGGQGVALAEGAFLYAPIGRRPPTGRPASAAPGACARGAARRSAALGCAVAAPRGRPTALPRWRSAAWQAARIPRRRTRRVISLACLFAFGAQGDPRGDVLRGRPRRTSPYRMRRGARTRSLVRALSALSRWVRCIGPITLRVLTRPCRPYT